jgi:uncharacterized membrane protein YczE
MLNLKGPIDVLPVSISKLEYFNINKRSMIFYMSMLFFKEINMSIWVGEHFIYLCIPEFFLLATYVDGAMKMVQRWHGLQLR